MSEAVPDPLRLDLLVLLAHPVSEPNRAAQALRLLGAALALDEVVGLYLLADGVTLLDPNAPEELRPPWTCCAI